MVLWVLGLGVLFYLFCLMRFVLLVLCEVFLQI